jgi:hypothetical protein
MKKVMHYLYTDTGVIIRMLYNFIMIMFIFFCAGEPLFAISLPPEQVGRIPVARQTAQKGGPHINIGPI